MRDPEFFGDVFDLLALEEDAHHDQAEAVGERGHSGAQELVAFPDLSSFLRPEHGRHEFVDPLLDGDRPGRGFVQ